MAIPLWNVRDFDCRIWLVDNVRNATTAADKLRNTIQLEGQRVLSVHLEGVSLGSCSGRSTRLSFASLHPVHEGCDVVMFDVEACPAIWSIVAALLRDPNTRKVMYDCTNALYAIQAQQEIRVQNAYDIAVAEYISRWLENPCLQQQLPSLNDLVIRHGNGDVAINRMYDADEMALIFPDLNCVRRVCRTVSPEQKMRAVVAADVVNIIHMYQKIEPMLERDVARRMMDQMMWERLNQVYDPFAVRESQLKREQARRSGQYFIDYPFLTSPSH